MNKALLATGLYVLGCLALARAQDGLLQAMRDAVESNPVLKAEMKRDAEREPVCPADHPNDPDPVTDPAQRDAREWRRIGRCALRASQPQQALDAFQHAATLDSSAESYSLWGLALVRMDRLAEVPPMLRKAAHADPQEDQLFRAWGAYYLAQGDLDRAASYYEEALTRAHPRGAGFSADRDYFTLGSIYARQEKHREAVEAYEQYCLAMICSTPDQAYELGVELMAVGERDKFNMLIEFLHDKPTAERLQALTHR